MARKDPLLLEIAELLAVADGREDPARMERTLTDGYARALALEAEQRRLEQRIARLTAAGGSKGPERREIASLVRDAARQECELRDLRGELHLLRRRHSSAVRAALVAS